jgi:hypothetical protein
MSALAEAIHLIEQDVLVKRARCVIADEGWPGESSLLGTRDGYLNLALALLRFVTEADAGGCRDAEEGYAWDDRIKTARGRPFRHRGLLRPRHHPGRGRHLFLAAGTVRRRRTQASGATPGLRRLSPGHTSRPELCPGWTQYRGDYHGHSYQTLRPNRPRVYRGSGARRLFRSGLLVLPRDSEDRTPRSGYWFRLLS